MLIILFNQGTNYIYELNNFISDHGCYLFPMVLRYFLLAFVECSTADVGPLLLLPYVSPFVIPSTSIHFVALYLTNKRKYRLDVNNIVSNES